MVNPALIPSRNLYSYPRSLILVPSTLQAKLYHHGYI